MINEPMNIPWMFIGFVFAPAASSIKRGRALYWIHNKTMKPEITCSEYRQMLKAGKKPGEDFLLIDVREQSEWDTGHIEGALLLPLGELKEKAEQAMPDKNMAIILYCRSGKRAEEARVILSDLGYGNIKCLKGGYEEYCAEE